ncbi:MAG: NAD(+) diphosphatase [Phormidesmis sp.]
MLPLNLPLSSPLNLPLSSPLNPPLLNPFAISDSFHPATAPIAAMASALDTLWFIAQGSSIVVTETEDEPSVPQAVAIEAAGMMPVRSQFLGYLHNRPCIAVALAEPMALPTGYRLCSLRSLYGELNEDLFAIAARTVQIIEWDRTHQYCGQCATPTIQLPHQRVKRCSRCNLRQYPQLSPAVIMLIYRGDEVLLARAPRFRAGLYSVLAGFVEPGESLEETVAREVREEVGIEIKNIRYFGSQPWPFPKSLMMGFIAEYDSGALILDPVEIEAADWFPKHSLPPVPGPLSIARKLIDWFISQP